MPVTLVCPYCSFSKEMPEGDIPPGAKRAICPRCGQKFEFGTDTRGMVDPTLFGPDREAFRGKDPNDDAGDTYTESPWENRTERGFFKGIFSTFIQVLFSPAQFFKTLNPKGGIGESLAFGLLIGAVGNMLGLFWPTVMMSGGISFMEEPLFGQLTIGFTFLFLMVLVPVGVLVAMFVYSAVLHLCLLMVRGDKNGFEATFRVIAYSQAAQGLSAVPLLGGWIAGIWQFIIQVIGLREIHGVSYFRVIMAFILPVLILFILVLFALVPLVLFFTQHWAGQV
ncbi:MAG: YIP1 family protein [Deltaproteobacteria bacterium]|jgi:hypothetical protein